MTRRLSRRSVAPARHALRHSTRCWRVRARCLPRSPASQRCCTWLMTWTGSSAAGPTAPHDVSRRRVCTMTESNAPAGSSTAELRARLHETLQRAVVGQQAVLDGLFISVLVGGHILLEG